MLACLLVVVRRFRRRRCTDVVVCCTVISGHEGTAETEVRSTDSAAVRTDRSSLSSPLQCIITKIVHCLSQTVIVTVNVEVCEETSVHQQCQSSAGIGGPRWYAQPQKMIVLKKTAAGTLSRLRATLHSRGQTSAFCCLYGRISKATG